MSGLEEALYELVRRAVRDELAEQLAELAALTTAEAPAAALTVDTAAERLGLSPRTVYDLVNDGKLRAVRFGRAVRIPAEALAEYLRAPAS